MKIGTVFLITYNYLGSTAFGVEGSNNNFSYVVGNYRIGFNLLVHVEVDVIMVLQVMKLVWCTQLD